MLGKFIQPGVHKTAHCARSTLGSWVGLGGTHGEGLIQVGTEINPNHELLAFYNLIKEGAPAPYDHIVRLAISHNDEILAWTRYHPATERVELFIGDKTTHKHQAIARKLSSKFYDGSTADFIGEREQVRGEPSNLVNFGRIRWLSSIGEKGSGETFRLGNIGRSRITMIPKYGPILASPSALGPNKESFQDRWRACAPASPQ